MTLTELNRRFSSEDACRDYLVKVRWPNGVECPRCASPKVHKLSRPWTWQCKQCSKNGYRFSPLVGTIFENTNYPLRVWFQVIYLMCQSKKGISALQIQRTIGSGSYRTAWYMCHRIRCAMQNDEFKKLSGVVEVDETYIGGKVKNRHGRGIGRGFKKGQGGTGGAGKVAVDLQKRKRRRETYREPLSGFVRETVGDNVSLIATDEHQSYRALDRDYPHHAVSHSKGEDVRGQVHTGTIDSFWSLLKRGIVGSFHNVLKAYLPLYLNEFTFRTNNRKSSDIFAQVLAGA